jgi:hypothetical protein
MVSYCTFCGFLCFRFYYDVISLSSNGLILFFLCLIVELIDRRFHVAQWNVDWIFGTKKQIPFCIVFFFFIYVWIVMFF